MEQQLDPDAINLAKSIRQVESNSNPNAKGASGEHGAYQFMPETWKSMASKAGVNVPLQNSTLEDQNKVAYTTIKGWKDQGYKPDQIASMWNSGSPNYEGNVGTNSLGVKYDTPGYVNKVKQAYQGIKGSNVANAAELPNTTPIQTPQATNKPLVNAPATGKEGLGEGISKGLQNVPSSAFNLAGGIGSMIMHPIKTAQGLGDIALGGVEKLIPGQQGHEQNFDALTGMIKDRYGSVENLKKTAIEDPVGLATDIATLFSGAGTAIKGASLAGKLSEGAKIGSTITKVFDAVNPINLAGKGIGLAGKGLGKVSSETLGVATGVGGKTIREGFNAALKGGEAYDSFKQGLKGNLAPEDLVNKAKGAVQEVVNNRNTSYQEMLKGLKEDPTIYNPTKIMDTMRTKLEDFGIKESSQGLDFSRSKFALDRTAQADINTLYEYVKGYGTKDGDLSAVGLDSLKRNISGYYSPNSDYRALTQAVKTAAKDTLENAPGYTKEMKNYSEATEWIDDTKKALSLGDKAMTETSFKKLTSAFKQNNEWRAQALKELDEITGGQLKSSIAGQQLSSITPRGLAKFGQGLEGLSAMHAAVSGGAGVIPLLATMAVSSPRLVGEFIRMLGITGRGFDLIMSKLGGKINSATIGATTRLTTPTSAFIPVMVNQGNKQKAEQEVGQEEQPIIDSKNLKITLKNGKIYSFPNQKAFQEFLQESEL